MTVAFKQRDGEPLVTRSYFFPAHNFLYELFQIWHTSGNSPQPLPVIILHVDCFSSGLTRNILWICLISLTLKLILPVSKTGNECFLMGAFILIIVYKLKQKQWFQDEALPVTK